MGTFRGRMSAFSVQTVCYLLILSSCGDTPPATSDRDIEQINLDQLQKMSEKPPKKYPLVLLDARSEAKFALGHLPGAINIPLPKMMANDLRLVGKTIIVYSQDWEDRISQVAWKKLRFLGYKRVYDFREGLYTWERSGADVVKSE